MKLEKKELLHLRRALLAYAPSKMTEHLKHKLTEALQALEAQRAPRCAPRCATCQHAIRIGPRMVRCLLRHLDQHTSTKACHVYTPFCP